MEAHVALVKENPREKANPISVLFFWWLKDLFLEGYRKDLDQTDLYKPLSSDESEHVTNRLEWYWNKELRKLESAERTLDAYGRKVEVKGAKKPSLCRAIIRAFGPQYLYIGMFVCLQAVVLRTLQPYLQAWFIGYFEVTTSEPASAAEGYASAGSLVACTLAMAFLMHHNSLRSLQVGLRIRVACTSLIYRKTLRMNKLALNETGPGQIVNMLSNDLSRFDMLLMCLHYVYVLPIQILIIGTAMYQKIGNVTFIAIASLLLLTIPTFAYFARLSRRLRARIAPITDRRVQLMNELINGIQVVKMYTWEKTFNAIVAMTRREEVKRLRSASYVRAIYVGIMIFTERTVLFMTLVSYVALGYRITSDVTYTLVTYLNTLQLSAAMFFPQAVIVANEASISIGRIEKFLLLDEVPSAERVTTSPKMQNCLSTMTGKSAMTGMSAMTDKSAGGDESLEGTYEKKRDVEIGVGADEGRGRAPARVVLSRVSANWLPSQLPPTLCDVSFEVEPGQLCALVGVVGAGKSSVLQLILRELPIGAGSLSLKRDNAPDGDVRLSYASQEPWLYSGTVRDNILFGQPYDKTKYQAVTKACALSRDFKQLPAGDMTFIGERGVILSGGQKARVNLARAVYRDADIYLLDDPLSAVDTRVARHLFNKCVKGYLHDKTRILVTHQLQFVRKADNVVVLERGSIKMQGPYNRLTSDSADLLDVLNRLKVDSEIKEANVRRESLGEKGLTRSLSRTSLKSSDTSSLASGDSDEFEKASGQEESEMIGRGNLSGKVFRTYFRSGANWCCFVLLLLTFLTVQLSASGVDYWVSYWTSLEYARQMASKGLFGRPEYRRLAYNPFLSKIFVLDEYGLLPQSTAIYVYAFCIVACISLTVTRSIWHMNVCMRASRNLHDAMFSNLIQATMKFFNANNSGRILNRFSKDIGVLDELLPRVMLEAAQLMLVVMSIMAMEAIINRWMIIAVLIIVVAFYWLRKFYLRTAQNFKRLEGTAKSPVFSHLNATILGLATIRSCGKDVQRKLEKEFDALQNVHTGTSFLVMAAASMLGLYLDTIATIFIAAVCYALVLVNDGSTLGSEAGLAVSQALIITGTLQYGLKQSTEMMAQMTAVERVLQYTHLPKEGPSTSDNPPPTNWPPRGRIVMENVVMRYSKDEPPVLKNVTMTIEPAWRVGVVGRTGAGKSSLISALFNLYADGLEGTIKIDGRNAQSLGLQELRSRISIIPQVPVLFSQSLRYNLDPFGQYEDVHLWEALREVELNDLALDQMVAQGGNNLSVGQRQLICLARAILRNNRILVLDEATANVDSQTDSLIQKTIRTKFANCTVITVAHRLHTVIDCDRIIVMDNGRVVEFGCPYELLRDKPKGCFAQMVQKTGRAMAQRLLEQAEMACRKNNAQRSLELYSDSSGSRDNDESATTPIDMRDRL